MGCFQWNKLKYTYFVFLSWHWVKLTPRLCWLLQWWNYCCAIALDGLACAEFKEFDEHKVELNLTWPMVKSNADRCTCNISALQLKFDHQKGCLSLSWSPSSDTMFYLWVVVCLYRAEQGSWMVLHRAVTCWTGHMLIPLCVCYSFKSFCVHLWRRQSSKLPCMKYLFLGEFLLLAQQNTKCHNLGMLAGR